MFKDEGCTFLRKDTFWQMIYDPHPVRGVSEPLESKLPDFRMITMEQCGHDPWKEAYAREEFFEKFFEIV